MNIPPIFTAEQRFTFARLVAAGIAQAVVTVAGAIVIRRIFDTWIGGEATLPERELWQLGAVLLGLGVLSGFTRIVQRVDAEQLGQNYVVRVRLALFDHLTRVPPRVLFQRARGAVLLRFINDLSAIRLWVSLGIARITVAAIVTTTTLGAIAWMNLPLAGVVAAVLILGSLAVLLMGRPLEAAVAESRRRRTYLANNVTDKMAGLAAVQMHGQVDRERRRIRRQSERLRTALIARARIAGGVRGLIEAAGAVATASAVLVGVQQVAAGNATPGTVVATITIVGVLIPQIRVLGRVYESWHASRIARGKLEELFALPEALVDFPDAVKLANGPGVLSFENLSVEGALDAVNVSAEAGQRIAIVGANGAGKSTLLAVAARLVDPDDGAVRLDGQDLRDVIQTSLRRAIGFIGSEVPLLRGTLERNLRYRRPSASEREMQRVIRLCGLKSVVTKLPEGELTRLTEGGGNLSDGQRERVSMARALVGRPRILLVDEADANLDPRASRAYERVLRKFQGTVLMVTHRIDRVRAADAVWHLKNGRLVEAGRPEDLLAGDGPTARLFRSGQEVA